MSISLRTNGYDPLIDFLKAYSIICVVLAHCLPQSLRYYTLFAVWGDMQVPMFILIQVFHAYKKGTAPVIKWDSLLNRIIIPFFIVQVIIVLYRLLFLEEVPQNVLVSSLIYGGNGPGSYYFWIYIQIAIVLVLIWPLVKVFSRKQLTWFFLLLSVGFEILFSIVHLPDNIYRLLAVRYLFLIPLALLWVNEGVVLSTKNVILSFISIGAVLFFAYFKVDLEPVFFNTGWSFHRWPCYYYLPILFTYLMWVIYKRICDLGKTTSIIKIIARSSYEIYLIQMIVFSLLTYNQFIFIRNDYLRLFIWITTTFSISIIGGILFRILIDNKYRNNAK